MTSKDPSFRWPLALWPLRIAVVTLVLITEIARPLYRPLVQWFSGLALVKQLDPVIGSLPRLAVLILFAVPFAVAEPLKIYALVLIAKGRLVVGLTIIVFAYLMSFVLVERIFHAGREKLLTYNWFKWLMERVEVVRHWSHEIASTIAKRVRRILQIA
ncbi:hypothetical protein [Neorhizobium sp. P12A]|uniref:hypothetical protein n=1 Tax=Neorhizobium sp. P12A TaxID=2268027 RepID=UPI00165E74AE|nr:hypothetical protein [Neorhizobium sp. P12A]